MKLSAAAGSKNNSMAKEKKRLSKKAKAAQKIVNDLKLLAMTKAAQAVRAGQEFDAPQASPRTATANKQRPAKEARITTG